ncbi:TIR domain-containing protein [Nostoc sp. MS1]|uniref:TIR domain-containing protein n=1 Tax=Nostoc sp. MS1 TaxID=2764711 RepID=UPI001CC4751C|nr:TIR domain-containing protein [Nostoc sp. MS1]BCL35793.1 hypothetical protein NSMS1_22400 [Nostoc sp. MS1]
MKKILILAANPTNTLRLRVDQEVRDIDEGLRRSQKRDQFSLETKLAVRPRDIQRALLDVSPQIIHFSGHGAGEEGLVFEDEMGNHKLVSGSALANLFKIFAEDIECVLLNGCYSVVQAEAINQHINYVIGMNRAIGDKAAIEFAVGFYDTLGAGKSIEMAYAVGCAAIQLEGIEENLTPVLLKKTQLPKTVEPLSSQPENRAIKIFFSYDEKDKELQDELAKHLKLMQREGTIQAWHGHDISGGSDKESEIEKHLNSAQIILLLISPDFIFSEELWERDVKRAMERHQAKEARVIPIILRPVDWEKTPFGRLQPLPKNRQPVTTWKNQDEAFAEIAKDIRQVLAN